MNKMTKKAEKLLRLAINEWFMVLDGRHFARPICVLCDEYLDLYREDGKECLRCPVFLYTGKAACVNTPDGKPYANIRNRARSTINFGNKILKAAGKEPVK